MSIQNCTKLKSWRVRIHKLNQKEQVYSHTLLSLPQQRKVRRRKKKKLSKRRRKNWFLRPLIKNNKIKLLKIKLLGLVQNSSFCCCLRSIMCIDCCSQSSIIPENHSCWLHHFLSSLWFWLLNSCFLGIQPSIFFLPMHKTFQLMKNEAQ